MPKTLHEQLEESFEKVEETGGSPEDTEESLRASEEEEGKGEELPGDAGGDKSGEGDGKEGEGESGKEARAKDDDDEPVSPDAEKLGAKGDADDDKDDKKDTSEKSYAAPASWKPAVREHWEKLPPEVQEEVTRRETEIQRGLQQACGHRRVAEEYMNVIRPYQHLIQAQNSTPAAAITSMMQTAAQLTMGSPAQKAQLIAEIIGNYAIDVEILDGVLSGQDIGPEHSPIMDHIDQRLAPLNDFMNRFQGYQEQDSTAIVEQANQDLSMFQSETDHEFYEDVREEMADLMELGARRGRVVTLQQAYDAACQNTPEVKKVIDHRAARKRAAVPSGDELANKRKAASSIAGSAPTGGGSAKGDQSLRESIAEQFEEGGRV